MITPADRSREKVASELLAAWADSIPTSASLLIGPEGWARLRSAIADALAEERSR